VREAVVGNLASVARGLAPLCVDEYQRVPEILALPVTVQALTGRLHSLTIWPLSQGEISGVRENLLETSSTEPDAVFGHVPTSNTTREDDVERACAGGLPMVRRRSSGRGDPQAGVLAR